MTMAREFDMAKTIDGINCLEEMAAFVAGLKQRGPIDSATQSRIALRKIELQRAKK